MVLSKEDANKSRRDRNVHFPHGDLVYDVIYITFVHHKTDHSLEECPNDDIQNLVECSQLSELASVQSVNNTSTPALDPCFTRGGI